VLHVLRVVRQHRKALVLGIVVEHCTDQSEAQAIRETLLRYEQRHKQSVRHFSRKKTFKNKQGKARLHCVGAEKKEKAPRHKDERASWQVEIRCRCDMRERAQVTTRLVIHTFTRTFPDPHRLVSAACSKKVPRRRPRHALDLVAVPLERCDALELCDNNKGNRQSATRTLFRRKRLHRRVKRQTLVQWKNA
jgi:hypothetical protein